MNKPQNTLAYKQFVIDYTEEAIKNNIQPDFAQNDQTASSYIKNRTHWVEEAVSLFQEFSIEKLTNTEIDLVYGSSMPVEWNMSKDSRYKFVWTEKSTGKKYSVIDTTKHYSIESSYNGQPITREYIWIGNGALIGSLANVVENTGEDYLIVSIVTDQATGSIGFFTTNKNAEDGIEAALYDIIGETVHKLDEKFIPDSIARISDITGGGSTQERLPNPYKLTFTGMASGEYDGSAEVNIDIPTPVIEKDWNQNDSNQPDYIKNRTHFDGEMVIQWDGDIEGRDSVLGRGSSGTAYYKISNIVPSYSDLLGASVFYSNKSGSGDENFSVTENLLYQGTNCTRIGFSFLIISDTQYKPDYLDETLTAPSVGVYVDGTTLSSARLSYNYLLKLDEKYIPDTIARVSYVDAPKNELVLNSSTEGSTKKFKITVDDEGVLTIMEIVDGEA